MRAASNISVCTRLGRVSGRGASAGMSRAASGMDYLPVFLRLEHRPVVVVGGGAVAFRKVSLLLKAGAEVTVIAPLLNPPLAAMAARGELRHIAAAFSPAQVGDAVAVIAATDDGTVNTAVSQAAQERRVPVN